MLVWRSCTSYLYPGLGNDAPLICTLYIKQSPRDFFNEKFLRSLRSGGVISLCLWFFPVPCSFGTAYQYTRRRLASSGHGSWRRLERGRDRAGVRLEWRGRGASEEWLDVHEDSAQGWRPEDQTHPLPCRWVNWRGVMTIT